MSTIHVPSAGYTGHTKRTHTHTHMCTWMCRTCCSWVQVVERQLEILESRSLRWKPVHFLASFWCAGSSVCSTLLSFLHGMFVIKQLPGGSGNTLEMLALLLFASQGLSPLGQPVGQMRFSHILRWCRVWQWCQPWWARWLFCWPSLQPSLHTNCPRMLIFFDSCVSLDGNAPHWTTTTHHCHH